MPFTSPPPPSPGAYNRPALRQSASSPHDAALAAPFEQLSLYDQDQLMKLHDQPHTPPAHRMPPYPHTPGSPDYDDTDHAEGSRGKGWGALERSANGHAAAALRNCPPPAPIHAGPQRPDLPHRNTSFSKRHASFDSPREVPLPYMTHSHHLSYSSSTNAPHSHTNVMADGPGGEPSHPVYTAYDFERPSAAGADHAGSASSSSSDSLPSAPSSSSPPSAPTRADTPMDTSGTAGAGANPYYAEAPSPAMLLPSSSPQSLLQMQQRAQATKNPSSPVHPFARPFSAPEAFGARQGPPRIHSPTPIRASGMPPDRSSTSSLPLPAHTPYFTLPAYSGTPIEEDVAVPGPSRPVPPQYSSSSVPASSSVSIPPPPPPYGGHRSPSTGSSDLYERSMSPPYSRWMERAYSSSAWSTLSGDACVPSPDSASYPPPAPPVVLTPPPPPLSEEHNAPHEPFLAHAPAPTDTYIAVETLSREYRLLIKLPGFRRDAITLSSRKRRILHVVADSWEPNGGHFERRISFGYDADLAQVRAEFDGEYLRVIVPRRGVPGTFWGGRRD